MLDPLAAVGGVVRGMSDEKHSQPLNHHDRPYVRARERVRAFRVITFPPKARRRMEKMMRLGLLGTPPCHVE